MAFSEISFYLPQGVSLETARTRYLDVLRRAHGGRIPRNLDPASVAGRAYYTSEITLEDLLYRMPHSSRVVVWSIAEVEKPAETLSALQARGAERIAIETLEPYHVHDPNSSEGVVVLKSLSMAIGGRSHVADSRFVRRHSDETIEKVRTAKKRGRPVEEICGQYKVSRSYYYKITKDIPTLQVVTPYGEEKPDVTDLLSHVTETLALDEKSSKFVTQFLMRYAKESTRKPYLSDIKKFLTFVRLKEGITSLSQLDEMHALSYQEHIRKTVKPRSQNRYISTLKALYKHLDKKKFITENPFDDVLLAKVNSNTVLTYRFKPEEVSAMLAKAYERFRQEKIPWQRAAYHRNALLMKLLAVSGLRIGLLLGVQIKDIADDGQQVTLRVAQKVGDEKDSIPLDLESSSEVRAYVAEHHGSITSHNQNEFLFFQTKHVRAKPISYKTGNSAFNALRKESGVNTAATPQSFRVHAACEWYLGGMPPREIQLRLGHSSIEQTMRYLALALGVPPEQFLSLLKGVS